MHLVDRSILSILVILVSLKFGFKQQNPRYRAQSLSGDLFFLLRVSSWLIALWCQSSGGLRSSVGRVSSWRELFVEPNILEHLREEPEYISKFLKEEPEYILELMREEL